MSKKEQANRNQYRRQLLEQLQREASETTDPIAKEVFNEAREVLKKAYRSAHLHESN